MEENIDLSSIDLGLNSNMSNTNSLSGKTQTTQPTTPAPAPIVNTAQNPTSNMKIKVWEIDELTNDNPLGTIILNTLLQYEKIMKPKTPIDKNIGGQQQTALYQAIIRAAQDKTNFNKNWEIILSRFSTNPNNVYGIQYCYRFLDRMQGSKLDVSLYSRLINLINLTAKPETRVINLRRVSVEKTLANVSSENIRSNILGYYRKYIS